MTPIFVVGEKVRVTDRVYNGDNYKYQYTDEMCDKFEGKLVTIKTVVPNNYTVERKVKDDNAAYYIEEDNGYFTWSSGMFDKIEPYPAYISNEEKNSSIRKKVREALYASLTEQGINIY